MLSINNIVAKNSPILQSLVPFTPGSFREKVSRKDERVETLRGLAIVLVVLGHMIGYTKDGGMRLSDDSVFRYIYYSLEYIRLPLFTVISGWVYANKPVLPAQGSQFLKGKLRRLLLPMFVVSTLLFLSRMIIPGTNTTPNLYDLPRNLIFPYDVYWYLFSLFLIFLLITVLDRQAWFRKPVGWALTLLFSFAVLFVSENFLNSVPNILSFKGAAYLLPFFLVGIGIHRYRAPILGDKTFLGSAVVFTLSFAGQQAMWFGEYPLPERVSVPGMAVGISAALLLFRLGMKSGLLMWIGHYAYGIFLFHVFFTGGTRIVLERLGVNNPWVILVAGVTLAISISIVLVTVISQNASLRFYLLGMKSAEK